MTACKNWLVFMVLVVSNYNGFKVFNTSLDYHMGSFAKVTLNLPSTEGRFKDVP
jgi:hypothetical protein